MTRARARLACAATAAKSQVHSLLRAANVHPPFKKVFGPLGRRWLAGLAVTFRFVIVRPPLLMLQYMFGMTRLALDINLLTLGAPLVLLLGILLASTWWTVRRETEKQAVAQMSGR